MRRLLFIALGSWLAGAGLGLAGPPDEDPVVQTGHGLLRATPARTASSGPRPTQLPGLPGQSDGCDCPGLFPILDAGLVSADDGPMVAGAAVAGPAVTRREQRVFERTTPERAHVWLSGEPLVWWMKPAAAPVLAVSATAPAQPVLGGSAFDSGPVAGARAAAGVACAGGQYGLEAGAFLLGERQGEAAVRSGAAGSPALVRPTRDLFTGSPVLAPLSVPGELAGSLAAGSSTHLWGAEANGVARLCGRPGLGWDFLGGFRYLDLSEDLAVWQHSTGLGGGPGPGTPVPAGASLTVQDMARTRNQFYGPQVGSQVEMRWGRVYTHLVGKAALGVVHEVAEARGETVVSGAGGSTSTPGGLLVPATAAGRQSGDDFAVVPEVNLNLGCQISPGLRLYAGYSFLYLNDCVRPGDVLGTNVSPGRVPGLFPSRSGGSGQSGAGASPGDFWAQGVNIGLALRY